MVKYENLKEMQPYVIQLLTNSLRKNRLSHAYLFYGNKGTGKLDCAFLLAQMFLCGQKTNEGHPCGQCINCTRIYSGNHPDVHVVMPDGTSIKTEQMQFLQKEYAYSGMESDKKVFIIKDCDMMTVQAANRMLKTIEEPLPGMLTIFTTNRKSAVLSTIQSRTQQVSFRENSRHQLLNFLTTEGISMHLAKVIVNMTTDLNEALQFGQDPSFADSYAVVLKLYETLETNKMMAFIWLHTEWLTHFGTKDRDKNIFGLSLFSVLLKSILLKKLGYADDLQIEEIANINLMIYHETELFAILDEIQLVQNKIRQNFNIQITLERFMLYLQEV